MHLTEIGILWPNVKAKYTIMKTFYRPTGDDSVYRDIELTDFVGTEDEVRQAYPDCLILEVVKA